MKNFIQSGRTLTVSAPADIKSGDLVVVGSLFGVAYCDAAIGADVEIGTEGVFELPKTAEQAWTAGAKIYWSGADKCATTVASGNTLIGHAVAAAANPSAFGQVRLSI